MRKNILTEELAEKQIDELNDFYDIDVEFIIPALAEPLKQHLLGIKKAIMRGRLSIEVTDDSVNIKQHLERPIGDVSEIVFKELTGKAASLADNANAESRVYVLLGSLSNNPPELFRSMGRVDHRTAMDIGNYFLFV